MYNTNTSILFKYRLPIAWLLTLSSYISIGTLLFYQSTLHISQINIPKTSTISMTLSEFVPPTPKEKVEEPKEIPKKEEIKEVVPPEPLKPLPRTEPKPKPEPKKVVKKPYKKPASIKRVQQSSGHFNLLMSKVRNKIDKNKSYPRIAKRRGLQGKVTVTFTILPNGNVSNIQLKGPTLFYRSAREAIRKAFPIKLNKFKVKLPKEVTIVLNYRLH